jgi:hypothetical protein
MRLLNHLDAHYLSFVGQMASDILRYNLSVWAVCDTCGTRRQINLQALSERVPWGYSLIDRRCCCKLTWPCQGWNTFECQDSPSTGRYGRSIRLGRRRDGLG